MSHWENINVISCVDSSGGPLSVIEQSRKDRLQSALEMNGQTDKPKRFVLGNGSRVEPLDTDRFLLVATDEVVSRV
jgi:hypothetical protein